MTVAMAKAAGGTMTIKPENGITSEEVIIPAAGFLGEGQTWQDMLGVRAANTDYPNDTGKPIMVSILIEESRNTASSTAYITVDGVAVAQIAGTYNVTYGGVSSTAIIIPPGSVYRCNVSETAYDIIKLWAELRA